MLPPLSFAFILLNKTLKICSNLGLLKKSGPSRIVNVSSLAHSMVRKFDPEDLNFDKMDYSCHSTYAQSKLCNVLFTLELSEKLRGTCE